MSYLRPGKRAPLFHCQKKAHAKDLIDYRTVALTSVLCKCMERVVCQQLSQAMIGKLDPLQFAYRVGRGVEDATVTLMDKVGKYLDAADCCVRILFMDFSSAFNTVNINIIWRRLEELHVHQTLILWIYIFLRDSPQQ